jgi:hypothetical protein
LLARDRTRAGAQTKWRHALPMQQDLLWRTVLTLFAELGRAPSDAEIAADTGLPAA